MIEWNADPVIFTVGSFSLRWYSLFFALTFLCSFYVMRYVFIEERVPQRALDDLFIYVFLGVVIGARLGHVIFYDPSFYLHNPAEILKVWKGGLASHGALAGVLVSAFIFVKTHPALSYLWVLDRMAIPAPLGAALVRLGNLFNSEIFGEPADVPWAFVFRRVDGLPRHPTQLYEAIAYLLLFLLMLFLYGKERLRERRGLYLGAFLSLTFAARFLLEFTKERQAAFGEGWLLNMGQILSLPPLAVGLAFLAYALRKGTPAGKA